MSCRTDISQRCMITAKTSSGSEDVQVGLAAATAEKRCAMADFVLEYQMLDHMLTADAMLREANMGVLDKLKIVALAKQVKGTVEQERRKKLAEQLTEQLKLAEAALGGVAYQRTKAAWETDAEGHRYRVQRPVTLRQWWTVADGGVAQFGVRYGAVPLQLQPGKAAVEVAKLADLPVVIKTLLQAVEAGELDAAVAAAMGSRGAKSNKTVAAKA